MKVRELAICGLCAFAGGFAAVAALDTGNQVGAETDRVVVKANEFILEGKDGATRARIGFDEEGSPNMWLTDAEGTTYKKFEDVEKAAKDKKRVDVLRKHIEELKKREEVKDESIRVAHILISFNGAARSTQTRTKDEAEALAAELLSRINKGEDFETLMKEFSNDPGPGIYAMSTAAKPPQGVYGRTGMVPAFGNVGWKLAEGEVGVAEYSTDESPFGWHIIKRMPLEEKKDGDK